MKISRPSLQGVSPKGIMFIVKYVIDIVRRKGCGAIINTPDSPTDSKCVPLV